MSLLTISGHVLGMLEAREPTAEEMERCLQGRDELPAGEPYPLGWPTIRRCRLCGTPVAGGPTACVLCVAAMDANERASLADRVLRDAVESGRIVMVQPPAPEPPACDGCGGAESICNCVCGYHFCGCSCHTRVEANTQESES